MRRHLVISCFLFLLMRDIDAFAFDVAKAEKLIETYLLSFKNEDRSALRQAHEALSQSQEILRYMQEHYPRGYFAYELQTIGFHLVDLQVKYQHLGEYSSYNRIGTYQIRYPQPGPIYYEAKGSNREYVLFYPNQLKALNANNRQRVVDYPNQVLRDNRHQALEYPISQEPSNQDFLRARVQNEIYNKDQIWSSVYLEN